jgi:hypothetical protein
LKKQILGLPANAKYNGFTSCPLILDNNDVLLAEFRYGLEPDETFTKWGLDQSEPRKIFYQMSASFGVWRRFVLTSAARGQLLPLGVLQPDAAGDVVWPPRLLPASAGVGGCAIGVGTLQIWNPSFFMQRACSWTRSRQCVSLASGPNLRKQSSRLCLVSGQAQQLVRE